MRYPNKIAQSVSLRQYFGGVYRSRVLAREAILGVANAVDGVLGVSGSGPKPGFVVGWVAVTGGGFLCAWWSLRRYRMRRANTLGPIEVVVAVAMTISATTLTPYDLASYALIAATFVAAETQKTLATALLAAAAVSTRESGLLVIAIIFAACALAPSDVGGTSPAGWTAPWRSSLANALRRRSLWAATVACLATYLVLKVSTRQSTGLILFRHVAFRSNLTADSFFAAALAAALVVLGRLSVRPAGETLRARRRVLWTFALPYLVVLAIGSRWTEAPRLVMPLVVGEVLLAISSAPYDRSGPTVPILTAGRGWPLTRGFGALTDVDGGSSQTTGLSFRLSPEGLDACD